ncbi:c-type cytochrome [Blattabacterium cuenoti]|uniref:c-type cytochrome n=1 Tax=Blattabacterium cuenoti TaxID=1653831 RepID=UPI00163BAB8F|nr:c-type cytochrome [Blattabacterium cuenoti]
MKNILFFFFFFFSFLLIKIETKNIEGNAKNGFELFKKNCTSCHSIDLEKKMIGPALSGITEKRSREWLHKWIINNKSLRDKGDKEALAIYKEYGNIEMNLFTQLSEKQVDDILFFIKNPIVKKEENSEKTTNKEQNNIQPDIDQFLIKIIVFGLSVLSIILLCILYKIQVLTRLFFEKEKFFRKKSFWLYCKTFFLPFFSFIEKKRKNFMFFSCFSGFLLGLYIIWNFLMKIDVNKGYKPEQPIYFSHKIHSGINKINCEYCHSSAKYSKVSGIPSLNVCMNCHITINEYKGDYIEKGKSRDEYNKEIQKIYHFIGWNKEKRDYSNNQHPIQWTRIHNMPDFVYFDHSQHIIVGKKMINKSKKVNQTCNACHGDVQNMDQVEMSNDFTMEWCISCHRNTEIDTNNSYYKEHFSNFINKKKKITVDMIGGTECAKCHY